MFFFNLSKVAIVLVVAIASVFAQTATYPVGTAPNGITFDGTNIWVTNTGDNTVTKLRATDGTVLGTFPTGRIPIGVAFDGANIWVANGLDNTITKLRATDGAMLGTFPTGSRPFGVAFDGANIWVHNIYSNTVTKLRVTDGAVLGTFPTGGDTGGNPQAVAFDGADIWVTNQASARVSKLRTTDGVVIGTFPTGNYPFGVTFDGANIWVANVNGYTVTKLRATDGVLLGTFPAGTNPAGTPAYGVAFDGANIWITNGSDNTVTKLRATDGVMLGTFLTGELPQGIIFDGANIWVVNVNGNTVTKFVDVLGDSAPPAISENQLPSPNSYGWNNTNVTIYLNATDNLGGSGVKQIQFALSGAENTGWQAVAGNAASLTISAEGITVLSYFATDNAGNQETAKTLIIRIDKTPPLISGLPAPGCSIWPPDHKLVQVATVRTSDALSGIAPGSFKVTGTGNDPTNGQIVITGGPSQFLVQLGADKHQIYTLTATASDLAGNTITQQATCTVPNDQGR